MKRVTDGLDRRLQRIEKTVAPPTGFSGNALAETETVLAGRNVTMVATHSDTDARKTWAVPLRLSAPIRAYQASFVAKSNDADEVVHVALAVYRAEAPMLDKSAPVEASFNLELFRTLGTIAVSGTTPQRYSITLERELLLNPQVGYYFIGFQTSGVKAKLLCPEFGFASGTMRATWKTTNEASTGIGDFPQTLTTDAASTFTPWIVLRSFAGVRMLGNATEDG